MADIADYGSKERGMTMNKLFEKLSEPFPAHEIEWRIGSTNKEKTKGMALAYIDARAVMDRLDSVLSPAGWQNKYSHAGEKTICDIGVLINNEWVWKSDGAGDTDFEAQKGALSSAFKRAAVRWGIGRYLYNVTAPWVAIEQKGRTAAIAKHEYARLQSLLPGSKIADAEAEEEDQSRALYFIQCEQFIENNSYQDIRSWWDRQSQARRDFGFSQEEVNNLINLIKKKAPQENAA